MSHFGGPRRARVGGTRSVERIAHPAGRGARACSRVLATCLLAGAVGVCNLARSDDLDSSGIASYIDESLDHSNWHCPLVTPNGEWDVIWNISTTYDLRFEGGAQMIPGEMGTLRMNNGRFALESLSGRKDHGYYQWLDRRHMYLWSTSGASLWTSYPRKASDTSFPLPPEHPPEVKISAPDAKIVGVWSGSFFARGGKYETRLQIEASGRYVWQFQQGDSSTTQTGVFEAGHGKWTTHPEHDGVDHGTYSVDRDVAKQRLVLSLSSAQNGMLMLLMKQ